MLTGDKVLDLVRALVNLVSAGACVWVLVQFHHLGIKKERIFPRQLRSLALVDVSFHVAHAYISVPWLLPLVGDPMCRGGYAVFITSRAISVLQELHIACYCLSVAVKSKAVPVMLGRTIPLVWLVGFAIGLASSLYNPWNYNASYHMCMPQRVDTICLGLNVVCGVLSFMAYVYLVVMSVVPGSVERRQLKQLQMYPVNFILTYGLITFVYLDRSEWLWGTPAVQVAAMLESLNGLMNVVTYAMQSRYRRDFHSLNSRTANEQALGGPLESGLTVNASTSAQFLSGPQMSLVSQRSHQSGSSQAGNARAQNQVASFHVGLCEVAEVHHIEADQKAAFWTAESQIQSLSGTGNVSVEYTTILFRNLPTDFSRDRLLTLLDSHGFAGLYDFVCMLGVGSAFINMTTPAAAQRVLTTMRGFTGYKFGISKRLEVAWSEDVQGLQALIEGYRNSPQMQSDMPEERRPMLFQGGVSVPFPQRIKKIDTAQLQAPRKLSDESIESENSLPGHSHGFQFTLPS